MTDGDRRSDDDGEEVRKVSSERERVADEADAGEIDPPGEGRLSRRELLTVFGTVTVVGGDGAGLADLAGPGLVAADSTPFGATDGRDAAGRIPRSLATTLEDREHPRFGTAVATDEGWIVVGVPPGQSAGDPDAGYAVVYERQGESWTRQATLVPEAGTPGGDVGATLAVDDATVVVGAPLSSMPNGPHSGSATVFERTGGAWHRAATLVSGRSAGVDRFGAALAVDCDTAVVGAPNDSRTGEGSGAAFVFTRSGGNWTRTATLGPGVGDVHRFGRAVALDGDVAVVGARRTHHLDTVDAGVAFVFRRTGRAWSTAAVLEPGDGRDDGFGSALAIDGDRILAGAPAASTPAGRDAGVAHAFTRSTDGWNHEATLLDGAGAAKDRFGKSVAVDGGTAIVGTQSPTGPAAFARAGGRWTRLTALGGDGLENRPEGVAPRRGGVDVALDGARAVVGVTGGPSSRNRQHGVLELFEP